MGQRNFTLIETETETEIETVLLLCGQEKHRFFNAMRRFAGKKIKGRGGGINSHKTIYTPAKITVQILLSVNRKLF